MEGFKRLHDVLHHIDLENKEVTPKEIGEGDLDEYIQDLLNQILDRPDNRYFSFQSETTEIHTLIDKILLDKDDKQLFNESSTATAERLLRTEIDAQNKYQNFTDIKKGSLIQSLFEYGAGFYYLITKVEHESFLNTEELIRQMGLPYEQQILKTCLVKITPDEEITDIIVSDSNTRIATYWVKDFLELRELNSDESNTKMAFHSIDSYLSRSMKKKAPADYTVLRNNLIGYFRTQKDFSFEHMVGTVFGEYEPEEPELVEMDKIKEAVRELPEKKGFDKTFSVIDQEIKARIRRVVKISDKIELNLKDHIDHLQNVIHAEERDNGQKFIVIKTENEVAYRMFRF